jgi:twinkle protein
MAAILPDTIDFSAYLRQTDASAKVRKASAFMDDLVKRSIPREPGDRCPEMFSTKLGSKIEFRPGEVTAWAGYNGHRKSMFTGQVALDLCVQRERVLMMSMEMDPADTLYRMARQAYAVARPASATLHAFSGWTDDRLWMFDHMGRITPAQCMAVVRYFAEELKGTQVFIDSMMMVCASEESMDEQKQFVTDTVRAAQEFGLHIHVIAHCRKPKTGEDEPPTKYDLRGSAAISDQCHNVITVWSNKAKHAALSLDPNDAKALADPDAMVTVEKQRNGPWEGRLKMWFHEPSMRFCNDRISAVEPYALGAQ